MSASLLATFIWSTLFSSLPHTSYLHCFLIYIKTSDLRVGQTGVCHSVKKSAWILSLCSITTLPLNSSDLFKGWLPLVFPVPVAGLISRHWGEAERREQLEILISLLQGRWSTALIKWPKASPGHTSKRSFSGAFLLNGFARVTKATSRDVIDFWKM